MESNRKRSKVAAQQVVASGEVKIKNKTENILYSWWSEEVES